MICSLTSIGFEIPPEQKASQTELIWLRSSPVITNPPNVPYGIKFGKSNNCFKIDERMISKIYIKEQ